MYRIPLEAMPSQRSYPALLDCLSVQAAGGWRERVCLSLSWGTGGVGVLAARGGGGCILILSSNSDAVNAPLQVSGRARVLVEFGSTPGRTTPSGPRGAGWFDSPRPLSWDGLTLLLVQRLHHEALPSAPTLPPTLLVKRLLSWSPSLQEPLLLLSEYRRQHFMSVTSSFFKSSLRVFFF